MASDLAARQDTLLAVELRDARALITRAVEALRDGDGEFAVLVLEDLAGDLWTQIERVEHDATSRPTAHPATPESPMNDG